MKNEVKTFYFEDHIRMWTVISKKKGSPCFPISVWPAASTVFPNLALHAKSLPISALCLYEEIKQHSFYIMQINYSQRCFKCKKKLRKLSMRPVIGIYVTCNTSPSQRKPCIIYVYNRAKTLLHNLKDLKTNENFSCKVNLLNSKHVQLYSHKQMGIFLAR